MFGRNHPETLSVVNYLAALLSDQGGMNDAKVYMRGCCKGTRRRSVSTTLNILSNVLNDRGEMQKATTLFEGIVREVLCWPVTIMTWVKISAKQNVE